MATDAKPRLESQYAKELIHGVPFAHRAEFTYLFQLEAYARRPVAGMADGMRFDELTRRHPEAWRRILEELDPKRLPREEAKERRRLEHLQRMEEEAVRREDEWKRLLHEAWLAAGGAP
jgi:hypothetical protein